MKNKIRNIKSILSHTQAASDTALRREVANLRPGIFSKKAPPPTNTRTIDKLVAIVSLQEWSKCANKHLFFSLELSGAC